MSSNSSSGPMFSRALGSGSSPIVELRVNLPREDLFVLDGYCNGTGRSRADVIRELLKTWSDAKHNEAIMVCRVAGVNPMSVDKENP